MYSTCEDQGARHYNQRLYYVSLNSLILGLSMSLFVQSQKLILISVFEMIVLYIISMTEFDHSGSSESKDTVPHSNVHYRKRYMTTCLSNSVYSPLNFHDLKFDLFNLLNVN